MIDDDYIKKYATPTVQSCKGRAIIIIVIIKGIPSTSNSMLLKYVSKINLPMCFILL